MSTLSCIGFHADSMEDHFILLDEISSVVKQVKTEDGYYFVYLDDSGAEIWVQTNEDLEPLGFKPHFSGNTSIKVSIVSASEDENLLGGTCIAWVESSNPVDWESGNSFVFDMPDYQKSMFTVFPLMMELNFSLFASKVSGYTGTSPLTYKNVDSLFINASYSSVVSVADQKPNDFGYMEGKLLSYAFKKNKLSGVEFLWLNVESAVGVLEVVCSPEDCTEELVIGQKVICEGWLSARRPGKPEYKESLNRVPISFGH